MTRAEYDHYYKILEPHIGKTEIVGHAYPDVLLTLLGTENYEEGVNEWPRALFKSSDGRDADLELSVTIDLLHRGNQ